MKCSCYGEIHKRGIFMELPQSAQQAQTAPSFEGAMKEENKPALQVLEGLSDFWNNIVEKETV